MEKGKNRLFVFFSRWFLPLLLLLLLRASTKPFDIPHFYKGLIHIFNNLAFSVAIYLIFIKRYGNFSLRNGHPISKIRKVVALVIVALLVFSLRNRLDSNISVIWLFYCFSVGLSEELFFRGVIFRGLLHGGSSLTRSLLYSGLFFGLAHGIPGLVMGHHPETYIYQVILAVPIGIFLGAMYYSFDNIFIAVMLHAIFNFRMSSNGFIEKIQEDSQDISYSFDWKYFFIYVLVSFLISIVLLYWVRLLDDMDDGAQSR